MHDDFPETFNLGTQTREWMVGPQTCPAINAYRMRLAGFSIICKGYRIYRRCPDFSQIVVCYEGHGELLLNNTWTRCKAGMAFLTPFGVPHAYRASANARWGVAWVMYDNTIVSSQSVALVPVDPWPLRNMIEGLYRQTLHAPDSPMVHHWLELIHGYANQLAGPCPHQGQLANVWTAVDAELARPWSLGDLARLAHLSVEHLRRLSHEQHGRSPMHQVAYCRIQRAVLMLSRTDDKIESIAHDVGFTGLSAFSVAFKRWIGVPPAVFRQKQSEKRR